MTDQKFVDDYYSQTTPTIVEPHKEEEKKTKIAIKRKVVLKKESPVELPAIEVQKNQEFKSPFEEPKVVPKIEDDFDDDDDAPLKTFDDDEEFLEALEVETPKKPVDPVIKVAPKAPILPTTPEKKPLWVSQTRFPKKQGTLHNDRSDEKKRAKLKKEKRDKYQKDYLGDQEGATFSFSNRNKQKNKSERRIEDIRQDLTERTGETVVLGEVLTVKEFSEKIGVPLAKLMSEFLKNGMKVTINSKIDFDTASIIADIFGVRLQKDISGGFNVEDIMTGNIQALLGNDEKENLLPRSPVISIMGHVDHGKTSLLDYIRETKVADKEAGGITQSIGAYQVISNGRAITFLDTPGHEAFTIMRTRGAKSTDIAVLVVAADEGVKPQTIESINHAKEAGIPIVVAINKIDKEGANPDLVKRGLSQQGIIAEDWGGEVPMINVSAKTGQGIDQLLEIILLMADMLELKANSERLAIGTVLESHLDIKLGPVATVLINAGTLKKGDALVCKGSYGKLKVLRDYLFKNITEAGPSDPVLIVGLDSVVDGGDIVEVVSDIEKARSKSLQYKELIASKKSMSLSSIDMILSKIKSGNLKQLKVLIKADTSGSLEAIKGALVKLSTEEVKVQLIHCGVGNITESDVLMCQGSTALLVGFGVEPLGGANHLINDTKVEFISSKIIYHITDRVEKIIHGLLDPKEVETILCEAKVGGIYFVEKDFTICGLRLISGTIIQKGAKIRLIRDGKLVGKGEIENLKSGSIDVRELLDIKECGIKFKSNDKVEMGDLMEVYIIEIQKY